MDAFVRKTSPAMPFQEPPAKVMHADNAPSPMQLLPDEVFAMITKHLLGPLDQLYTPYGCARAIASLGQTNQHFRLALQKLWPVRLVHLRVAPLQCQLLTATAVGQALQTHLTEHSMDEYKALIPGIKWPANPNSARDLQHARRVS